MKLTLILSILLISFSAYAGPQDDFGDEDGPFPLSCTNFSGSWTSDFGAHYEITQKRCAMLKIKASMGSDSSSTTIVPDNKSRTVTSGQWTGQVRHRWNSTDFGTSIETYRTMFYDDIKVTEAVVIELVNESLLLESVYRTVQPKSGKKRQEVTQQVFRRNDWYDDKIVRK